MAGFNFKTQDFAEEIMKATGGNGVDLIIESVGQTYLQKVINCATRNGRLVILAMISGAIVNEIKLAPILSKRLQIEGSRALRSEAGSWSTSGIERQSRAGDVSKARRRCFYELLYSLDPLSLRNRLM
jgi:NADPH:quinone reductase-like Zn-dependent oxidoreductase